MINSGKTLGRRKGKHRSWGAGSVGRDPLLHKCEDLCTQNYNTSTVAGGDRKIGLAGCQPSPRFGELGPFLKRMKWRVIEKDT